VKDFASPLFVGSGNGSKLRRPSGCQRSVVLKIKIIFQITCVLLVYRMKRDDGKKKVDGLRNRFPRWEFFSVGGGEQREKTDTNLDKARTLQGLPSVKCPTAGTHG
jgi:hypothetical protein